MAAGTRERLRAATVTVLGRDGLGHASARVIAAEAGVSQALIFYHYGSVTDLLADVATTLSTDRARVYTARLSPATSLQSLLATARELHQEETANGNVAAVRQLVALAAVEPALQPALRRSFEQLAAPVEATLRRIVTDTALEDLIDVGPLAEGIAGGFLGLQLLDGVVVDVDDRATTALDQLAPLVDVVVSAGVLETGLIRQRLKRSTST